ncbi:MAG: CdaR family protein [Thermodesulfovibrionales bacterium]|nr:CdaR family protein [Thermodesulfovibrionales bacterium]
MIQQRKIRQSLYENIWLLVIALLTSLSLWFFVTYKGQSETNVEALIEFKNIPKGYEILKQSLKKVSLNIRGHDRLIKNLNQINLRVIVDLSTAKIGENIYYFDKDNVTLPKTIKVLKIEPNFVKVHIDELVSRYVPVKVVLTGIPEKGYKVKSVTALPHSVVVEGAKSEVSKLRLVKTETIEIAGIDNDLTVNAKVIGNGGNIRIEPNEVNVIISIIRSKQ